MRVTGLSNSGRMRPRSSRSRKAGATVTATSAAATITSVLVKASGRRRRPVSPEKANTGRKLSAVMSSEVRIAGVTVPAAARIEARRVPTSPPGPCPSMRRWQASSATTSASTAIPSAMAMPPRLMIVADTPKRRIPAKVRKRTSGSVTSGTSALRPCRRNSRITSTTTPTSSASARSSVWSTRLARSRRS